MGFLSNAWKAVKHIGSSKNDNNLQTDEGGSSLLDLLLSMGTGYLDYALDFRNSRKETTKAYERNLASWLQQTSYNSPSKQMDRLKAAGLNPNLIYGSVNNSAGAVSSAPVANPPSAKFDIVSKYQDLRQRDAMTQQIDAQRQLLASQKRVSDNQTFNSYMTGDLLMHENTLMSYNEEMRQLDLQNAKIRQEILKKSLPAVYRQLEHQSGDWYNYWNGLREMTSALLPLSSTVSNIGGLFPSEHIYRREF